MNMKVNINLVTRYLLLKATQVTHLKYFKLCTQLLTWSRTRYVTNYLIPHKKEMQTLKKWLDKVFNELFTCCWNPWNDRKNIIRTWIHQSLKSDILIARPRSWTDHSDYWEVHPQKNKICRKTRRNAESRGWHKIIFKSVKFILIGYALWHRAILPLVREWATLRI